MAKKKLRAEAIKKQVTSKDIKIRITCKELIDARDSRGDKCIEHPRELVAEKFLEAGFVVTNFLELKYFNKPWGFIVEGNTLNSIMPK